jgi:DNA repair protein RadC
VYQGSVMAPGALGGGAGAAAFFREALRIGPALAAPEATRTFLLAQLRDRPYEVFCCLYLYVKSK